MKATHKDQRVDATPRSEWSLARVRDRLVRRPPRELEEVTQRAAVALLLQELGGALQVLLIRRSRQERDPWSGHMAFPGGRREPNEILVDTARRETLEEIGIDPLACGQLVGRLDDVQATARGRTVDLVIAPFVFALGDVCHPSTSKEVDAIYWVDVERLASGAADATIAVPVGGESLHLPAFDVEGSLVWGLTYGMLHAFFRAVR